MAGAAAAAKAWRGERDDDSTEKAKPWMVLFSVSVLLTPAAQKFG